MDSVGITPESLEATISRCKGSTGQAPKVLYLVPSCQNPTGSTLTLQRKQEVYNVCKKYNVCILEDDPYALLQFPNDGEEMPGAPRPTEVETREGMPASTIVYAQKHPQAFTPQQHLQQQRYNRG